MTRIGIAGAGAWGMGLAHATGRAGSTPVIWSRRGDAAGGKFSVSGDAEVLSSVDMLLLTMSAQEMAAVKAITTIHTAETQYYSQYGQYATSLNQLGPPTSGTAGSSGAELIDKELAAGEKGNFKFVLSPTQTGYGLTAVPTQFGTSGTHTFFSDQSMAIHQHSGPEPATVNDPLVGEKEQQQQAK